MDMIEMINKL